MGNTFKKWTDNTIAREVLIIANQFDPPKMPTRKEVSFMYGNEGLVNAISKNGGFEYWASKLGLPQGYSETKIGKQAEAIMMSILMRKGFKAERTSTKHPYDILVDGCVKIDVKAANISLIRGCEVHAYRLAKAQHTCDIYLFHEIDSGITYVVPAHLCNGQVQVEMGIGSKKYDPYKESWDLIKRVSDFYKQMT